jgi:hypothetical protein
MQKDHNISPVMSVLWRRTAACAPGRVASEEAALPVLVSLPRLGSTCSSSITLSSSGFAPNAGKTEPNTSAPATKSAAHLRQNFLFCMALFLSCNSQFLTL